MKARWPAAAKRQLGSPPDELAAPDEVSGPPPAVPLPGVPLPGVPVPGGPLPGGPVPAAGGDSRPGAERPGTDDPLPTRVPAASAMQPRSGGMIAPAGLSGRLLALARMIQIGSARSGRAGFSKKLLSDAEAVLGRAGDRMRLSSGHTVVVLAGGTGSGKSSLFNRLAGADFSTVGVTRPVTREAHACIWGDAGSGALLDWLGVPGRFRYSRDSALGVGEQDLAGLVLLDLPDHDSVMSHATDLVDRMVSQSDVMVWVLDPQKYADAAVHRRFLIPLAGHSDVLSVVLNQADLLDDAQIDDCVADLRRLLDAERLAEVPILVASALTGTGIDGLRKVLASAVVARRAAASRISADLDRVVARFEKYGADAETEADGIPAGLRERLTGQFATAAGVAAVGDSLRSARELRAADFVGWPVAWPMRRITGRDPIRKMRLGTLWNDLRSVTAGPSGVQQAEVDNALTELGDAVAGELPAPWGQTVRVAARSRADKIPAALGQALGETLPPENSTSWWWRLAGVWQGILLGGFCVGLAWLCVIPVAHAFGFSAGAMRPFTALALIPWLAVLTVALAVIGALSASACMALVRKQAELERAEITATASRRISEVAHDMAIMPAEQELLEFGRFRDEFAIASRLPSPQD